MAPKPGRSAMTPLHQHHGRPLNSAATYRFSLARAVKRIRATLKVIHQAIAAAKIRRLRNELMFHSGRCDHRSHPHAADGGVDKDGTEFPRLPLVLGDKWDF
jgi:hypothetical protein